MQRLTNTILNLESDEVLEQMRNDESLYNFKVSHIKEILEGELTFANILNQAVEENEALKEEKQKLEESLMEKCE